MISILLIGSKTECIFKGKSWGEYNLKSDYTSYKDIILTMKALPMADIRLDFAYTVTHYTA